MASCFIRLRANGGFNQRFPNCSGNKRLDVNVAASTQVLAMVWTIFTYCYDSYIKIKRGKNSPHGSVAVV
jgi:hypothetical protein